MSDCDSKHKASPIVAHQSQGLLMEGGKLITDALIIVEHAQKHVYSAVNVDLVKRNWMLGRRVAQEDLFGRGRAEYGTELVKKLSNELTQKFGRGFDCSEIYRMIRVYNAFPDLFEQSADAQQKENILETLFPKSPKSLLSWAHYCKMLQVEDENTRQWYASECAREQWSVRALQRNISTQYCARLLASRGKGKELVRAEMQKYSESQQSDPKEFIKNPVVVEFLGLSDNASFRESDLETAIINNLQKFLMEMGKGWAFVGRQQHIHTEKQDYYIDLVFYNVIIKCYILIDLKTEKITYQDVGQMDMYVKMYDELRCTEGDNPTLGIILCSDTDEDVAKYAMRDKDQLFASKYITYLPTKEQLRLEIERQKTFLSLLEKTHEGN